MSRSDPFISILNGFADASLRLAEQVRSGAAYVERELHPIGDCPVGGGWICTSSDGIDAVWERWRTTPTAQACADVRAWQRERAAR